MGVGNMTSLLGHRDNVTFWPSYLPHSLGGKSTFLLPRKPPRVITHELDYEKIEKDFLARLLSQKNPTVTMRQPYSAMSVLATAGATPLYQQEQTDV